MDIINTIQNWLKDPFIIKIIQVCIGILVITLVIRVLSNSVPRYIQDNDIRYHLRKAINFIGYGLIFLFAASIFSDNFRQLTVIFGVIGAGIAFALQEVIASFAGWVAISFGQFYKPGDRVLLGGIMGDVIDISILRSTLMECGDWVKADLYNGRIVRIANSFVFKEPVFNYSADFPFVWDEITVPVKYGSDRRLTKEIIQRVADYVVGEYVPDARERWQNMVRKYLIEDARIEPSVTLIANDNWMEFTLRYVVDYKKRRGKKDELFTNILDEIDRTEGRVSIASTTVHLVQTPIFDVRVSKDENGFKAQV
ncbi:mechanosensitive ion channel family protein [Calothrix sp. UHCC 0171]|uniref:mechanosensitive ion channel family protein n=1 Tax=Calothrix sp. UHCC 0171 TaxID=3110245 RepID=UPI002B204179|nr:mechanosensitive ion channel domain-containing protein [Calothrix sp. UHCC 0171]MEA5570597.1 mechanosensitive ion channel domain-containing protein [Calothrix sp. UHCC 0171]